MLAAVCLSLRVSSGDCLMWTFCLACEKGARVERGEIERKSDRGKTTAKHEMSSPKAVDVPLSVPFQVAGHGELCLSFVGFGGGSFFTLFFIFFSSPNFFFFHFFSSFFHFFPLFLHFFHFSILVCTKRMKACYL